MKTAICYYSRHHGNTLAVLKAMSEAGQVDLIDITARTAVHLEDYDAVGFASGIYYGKFHDTVLDFARQYLPEGKTVFFVYTYGAKRSGYSKAIAQEAAAKHAPVLGEYSCKGYDTFGPFRLIGGLAKGHPNADELAQARTFFRQAIDPTAI